MMNAKKLMIATMTGAMVLGAAATAHASFNFDFNYSSSESTSETKTVEDSKGNKYEVTHTVETVNGETTERYENVPFEIYNETGEDIVGLYIANSDDDTWGDNLLASDEEDFTIVDGGHLWGLQLGYNPNTTLLDWRVDFEDGTNLQFTECSLNNLEDGTHVDVEFCANGDGSYQIVME